MSTKKLVLGSIAVVVLGVAGIATTGCYDSDLCEFVTCQGVTTSTATGTPVIEAQCDPLDTERYAPDASCGVFVREGANGAGTPEDPMGSLVTASTSGRTVYVCVGTYAGSLSLGNGVTLFGGLSCDDWKHVPGQRSRVEGTPDEAAVGILAGAAVTVRNLDVVAADATATVAGTHGGSSIALFARSGAVVQIVDSHLTAGAGANGLPGTDHDPEVPARSTQGTRGEMGCVGAAALVGSPGGAGSCDGVDVAGGRGGNGDPDSMGGTGEPGLPTPDGGLGGKGADGSACAAGITGQNGTHGLPGAAAKGTGTADDLGYVPPVADSAGNARPGTGGGGGGGARLCMGTGFAGPSGGGGGAGGCGGVGGGSGGSGGASIGVLALAATVSLESSEITTGTGGNGGNGGRGARGLLGGLGGEAGPVQSGGLNVPSCAGGAGGDGGQGGPGAGGDGGFSVGILFLTTPPTLTSTMITAGMPGTSGDGAQNEGDNFELGPSGATGTRCASLAIGPSRDCAQ